jgi:Conjugal transfer protein
MTWDRWLLLGGMVSGVVVAGVAGCTLHDAYPPALPAKNASVFGNDPLIPVTPPPPELAYEIRMPKGALADWEQWRPAARTQTVCQGKGKKRRCTKIVPTAVDQANVQAVVKPAAIHTAYGQSIQVRYPLEGGPPQVFEITTSPREFSHLVLPPGERLAAPLRLDPAGWEILYSKRASEGARQEMINVRPTIAPQTGRDMLLLESGNKLYLRFQAQDRPGMLSVTWDLSTLPKTPAPLPVEQRPPKFNAAMAYTDYKITLEKGKYPPPWLPKAVADDGKNTLIHLPGTLEGQQLPSVIGLQQNGATAIVASRLYVRPDHPEDGAVLYVQGLHPALRLKDAAQLVVLIVRQVPASVKEVKYVP